MVVVRGVLVVVVVLWVVVGILQKISNFSKQPVRCDGGMNG